MSGHTPGPWKLASASSSTVIDSADLQVASVYRRERVGTQAAAPLEDEGVSQATVDLLLNAGGGR